MNSEAFLSLYLREIGVQAPISSFVGVNTAKVVPVESRPMSAQQDTVVTPSPVIYAVRDEPTKTLPIIEEAEPEIPFQNAAIKPAHDLQALQQQADLCQSCDLVHSRNTLVFGSGSATADMVFIGDAPGREEDVAGLPYVGSSGDLFDRMLRAIGLSRDEVYLMNGVKCRPLHSRDPKPAEFAACDRWLIAQLDMIQPRLICLLGRVIAQSLLATDMSLSELRQQQHTFRGIPVLVIDHPSYLLRSQQHKSRAWVDLCHLQETYRKLQSSSLIA